MGNQLLQGSIAWVALLIGGVTATTTLASAADPLSGGVLDRMSMPAVTAIETTTDGRMARLQPSADPVAVPTPTAAESGAVILAGLVLWRTARRVAAKT